ncbi:hypothetical protein LSAT2_030120, partial [Lamellibrachia satsuma]
MYLTKNVRAMFFCRRRIVFTDFHIWRGCGGRQYNVNVQICCGDEIRRQPRVQPACCGKWAYSKRAHKCVNGYVQKKRQQGQGQQSGSQNPECGRRPYDPDTKMCCRNIINPKPARQPRCCFGVSYSRATHMCRNRRVVR